MKKTLSLILALTLVCSILIFPASAAVSDAEIENTIKVLGIMSGDSRGNMNLDSEISRAEFISLMVNASVFKDTVGNTSGYTLFKDLKSTHWAAPAVKVAVDNGWVAGFVDGTFRPDKKMSLEDAATAVIQLLGYSGQDLSGSFPTAQLNKYRSLGLDEGVTAVRGQNVTRRDCMVIFYNALTAVTKRGEPYAITLGYSLDASGKLDYTSLVNTGVKGPYILTDVRSLADIVPFSLKGATFYKNGNLSTSSAAQEFDVFYYHKDLRTVWLHSKRITGTITAVMPSTSSPSTIIVSGITYLLGTSVASYKVSDLGVFKVGSSVTLLLGRDDSVCDIVTSSAIVTRNYGIVIAVGKDSYKAGDGSVTAYNTATVAGTDGVVRVYSLGTSTVSVGSIVEAGYTGKESEVTAIGSHGIEGTVNSKATEIGAFSFAPDPQIIDTNRDGAYVKIAVSRLAGANLGNGKVRYYSLDETGKIDNLILNDATGDLYSYGILTNVVENASIGTSMSVSSSYSYIIDGKTGVYNSQTTIFNIKSGGAVFTYDIKTGQISKIKNTKEVTLSSVGILDAVSENKKIILADDVQIYTRSNNTYTLVNAETISDSTKYNYRGYIDNNSHPAGGVLRVIVATPKQG